MKKRWMAIIGGGVLVIGMVAAGASFADSDKVEVSDGTIRIEKQSEADFPSMAKIPMGRAVQNALASVPGQVLKTELEDENGFLVYGIEVVAADRAIMEVKVDAGSGKVVAMEQDKADDGDFESRDDSDRESEHG